MSSESVDKYIWFEFDHGHCAMPLIQRETQKHGESINVEEGKNTDKSSLAVASFLGAQVARLRKLVEVRGNAEMGKHDSLRGT